MLDTVRAAGVTGFRRLLRQHGADPKAILAQVGLDESLLDDPDRQIPYRKVLSALERAAAELDRPDLGLQLAMMQDLSILGPLALAVQSASTLREGILAVTRHMHFHTPGLACELRPLANGFEAVSLSFLLPDLPPVLQATEHAVAHLVRMAPLLTESAAHVSAIHFRHPRLSALSLYERLLGVAPQFESPFDGVTLGSADLRRPIITQNPTLQAFVEHYLIGVAPAADLGVADQARSVMASLMRAEPVGLDEVARVLRLHPRALQRRLQKEGVRFADLLDEARRDLALRLLQQTTLPLSRISQIVGFAEQSVFSRACRRWFDTSPLEQRRRGSPESTARAKAWSGIDRRAASLR